MEWFGGGAPPKAAAEFRNSYTLTDGKWTSQVNFTAKNAGDNSITLAPGEGGQGVILETTRNALDPATGKPKKVPVVNQTFTIHQPDQPDFFEPAKITQSSAEWLGKQLVARWQIDSKATPQLGYDIAVFDGSNQIASYSWNDPEARECALPLPAVPTGAVSVHLVIRDIYDHVSPEAKFPAVPSQPLAASEISHLEPGLSYRYFETNQPASWAKLPDFSSLSPVRTGVTAIPDITPRTKRLGYAFAIDGYLRAPTDGLYSFNLVTASGAKLDIDGKTIIDADGDRSIARYPDTVALKAGVHAMSALYYQGQGRSNQADDFLQMTWAGPGFGTTIVPASVFSHTAGASEPILTADARIVDGISLELSSQLSGFTGNIKRVEYYAVNDHFDYFTQQGAQSEDYFLAAADQPEKKVSAPIWAGDSRTIFARAILSDNRTVDSIPVVVRQTTPEAAADSNGMVLTELEHHQYPPNHAAVNGTITLVGDSMNLLTRPHKGDVTIIAHLAGITSDQALADGTRLESAGNWFSGIILRNNLDARPGEPFGGAQIPYITIGGSADGATRHCDSTMINGAGNQLSGDVGSSSKWFKLTRKGAQLCAYISKDGITWRQVSKIDQPKLTDEIQIGFVHYSIPCAVPCIHWAEFDKLSISDQVG
jgi:hypothetical protein